MTGKNCVHTSSFDMYCDLVISIAYFLIPIALFFFLCRIPMRFWPEKTTLLLFIVFIFSCGCTHFVHFLTDAPSLFVSMIKCVTAIVSVISALVLFKSVPLVLQTEADIREARERVAKEQSEKVEILSFVCHELRNPLFAITSSLDFLSELSLPESAQEYFQSISEATTLMIAIVNDVLDLQKLEKGKMEFQSVLTDLHTSIQSMLGGCKAQCLAKGLEFDFKIKESCLRYAFVDPVRIQQIILNFLSNAVKFTNEGRIRLSIACEEISPSSPIPSDFSYHQNAFPKWFLITVQDTGIGIPNERMKSLFQPYSQLKFTRETGTGLGLAICFQLVKQMGGQCIVQSVVGQGSRFTARICLNFLKDDSSKSLPNPVHYVLDLSTSSTSSSETICSEENVKSPTVTIGTRSCSIEYLPYCGKSALVVDDSPVNRKILTKILSSAGFNVETAANGLEAVQYVQLHSKNLELILCDISMPIMDGYTACKEIRKHNHHIPIIALTALVSESTQKKVQEVGFNAYLTKPVKRNELLQCISQHISISPPPTTTTTFFHK